MKIIAWMLNRMVAIRFFGILFGGLSQTAGTARFAFFKRFGGHTGHGHADFVINEARQFQGVGLQLHGLIAPGDFCRP